MGGNQIAWQIKSKIKETIEELGNVKPALAMVLVGDNPASKTYLKNKHEACFEVGIDSRNIELSASTTQADLETAQGLERRSIDYRYSTAITAPQRFERSCRN